MTESKTVLITGVARGIGRVASGIMGQVLCIDGGVSA